ncbi:MAG: DnaA regulatory inactivator Hda [Halieaceae bacterium MED-G27]|nr:MAG: DnaA regulatory inactivator Hda [Halieaceae bacterium MED-G27]
MSAPTEQLPLAVSLNPEATWAQWVRRSATREIEQAANDLCQIKASTLYVWGGVGTGKSHLLQAVCQQANATAIYLPLRSLLDYPPAALLEAIEAADLIAFDDVDCIDVSQDWQEALFHTFNRCQAADTSMLFAATLAPSALESILPDLRSRLAATTVFQLPVWQLDDFESLLVNRAAAHGLSLTPKATRYLATRLPRTGAAVAKAMSVIDQSSLAQKRSPTVPFLKTLPLGI